MNLDWIKQNVMPLLSFENRNLVAILLTFLITYIIMLFFRLRKEKKIKKIKYDNTTIVIEAPKKRRMPKFVDIEKNRMKLLRAGMPLYKFGLDHYNFHIVKWFLALLSGLTALDRGYVWTFIYSLMGYTILELYVKIKAKRRKEAVEAVMSTLISTTVDGLRNGLVPSDIMSTVVKKLPPENPLVGELKIVQAKLSKGQVSKGLERLAYRLNIEQIDNYCYALMQYEIGGRAVTMLSKQLELIIAFKANSKRRETETKKNFSSISVALLVSCLILMIIMPLISLFGEFTILN